MEEPTICYVAGNGDLERLREELNNVNCDLEAINSQGLTPLMMAAKENHLECVRVLILAGANPNAQAAKGTASEYTVHPEILQIIAEARNRNGLSRFPSENTQQGSFTSSSPSVCRFFMKGYCRFGNSCRFTHQGLGQSQPELPLNSYNPMPTCRYWLQGNCRFGNQCRYEHPVTARPDLPFLHHPYAMPLPYIPMPLPVNFENSFSQEEYNTDQSVYDKEIEERIENFGFTEEEVDMLLSYEVMPWESNAWEILKAIQN
ncbi:hypothetical protein K7432_005681 [Basidiobolus ranarum]|uniref:C3H1-type domain-containing protein n=1 Tax=Basidiobolus ranarum TaxID=34480 RepID=A0ABR2WWA6_9FUNG